ncbi:hypothetical protein GCM10007304_46670 [Rhodococcoides trifolii]|uniref:HNH nuclease domain-containing protein n=1 Tax=Rhodococcoides trifolii TaxID=908250 RepID=A0A917G800_9NOCA|nr:hypothetical protein GCM10007304_46670 [Rhodococcus trifolii]
MTVEREFARCLDCSKEIDARPSGRGPRRQRCTEHAAQRKKELIRARDAYNRAVSFGVPAELVIAREVFERDRWRCHICNRVVPKKLRGTRVLGGAYDPLAPVVDHVVPLSKGGPHTFENCKTAHWTCNARKHTASTPRSYVATVPAPGANPIAPRSVPQRISDSGPLIGRPRVNIGLCCVTGCGRGAVTRRMCQVHYHRARKYGDPLVTKCGCGCGSLIPVSVTFTGLYYLPGHGVQSVVRPPAQILREGVTPQAVSDYGRVRFSLVEDCLIWTGPTLTQGYGCTYVATPGRKRHGRSIQTHRLAYELHHGAGSAEGWTIDHLCGVRLCCNVTHLEAVTIAVNLARAAERVVACPRGHKYDEANTSYGLEGHRRCRQCNTDRYHVRVHGHEFVDDPTNPSEVRRRCLTCRLVRESRVDQCPRGHEYSVENKRVGVDGKRYCRQCAADRDHIDKQGHPFLADPNSPNPRKRRCLTCLAARTERTHCVHGHELTLANTVVTRRGQRNCLACQLNARHTPVHGHDFVIDPTGPTTKRRCLTCRYEAERNPRVCLHGHLMTPENTYNRARRGTECRQCIRNRTRAKG